MDRTIREKIVRYFIANGGPSSDKSYYEVGVEFGAFEDSDNLTVDEKEALGEKVRSAWRYYERTGQVAPKQKEIETPYDGLIPKKVWESATKGGGKQLLHSYEVEVDIEVIKAFRESMERSFKKAIQDIDIVTWQVPSQCDKALMIYTADKHVGAETSEGMMFDNKYNPDIFEARMMKILDKVAEERQRYGTFKEVVFFELGDSVDGYDGMTTRRTHPLDQNLDSREQYDAYFRTHKKFFDALVDMECGETIRFVCAGSDNHGGPFSYMAQRAVEIYLNARYPQVRTAVRKAFVDHIKIGKHVFMYSHGKDEHYMKHGFPLVLDNKTIEFIDNYLDYHELQMLVPSATNRGYFLHFIKGDLHRSAEQFAKRFRYKNVMSVYGSSNYTHTNYGFNLPGAEYEIVDMYGPDITCKKIYL